MPTLPRNTAGLLYKDDFSLATGWTAGTGWTFDSSLPAYCVFDPLPGTYEYGALATATDGDGVREFHLFEDSAGVWWLFYGAGDRSGSVGTAGAGAPWRIHLAKSTDRGVTWQRLGPLNVQLQNGAGGNDAAKDMLFMEQRGATFYLHVMRSATANATGIPAGPYTSQMWTNTALGVTGWTYANEVVTTGSLGNGNDTRDDYTGCVVGSNTAGTAPGTSVYHLFTSTSTYSGGNFTGFGVGHFIVSGPLCQSPTPHPTNPTPLFVSTGGAGLSFENPKTFWSPALNLWVMFITKLIGTPLNVCTVMYTSVDLKTWNTLPGLSIQHRTPLHGLTTGTNILSPGYHADGGLMQDANSYLACTYDTDSAALPVADTASLARGRRGRFVVAEPALNALHFAPATTTLFSDTFNNGTNGYTQNASIIGLNGWTRAIGTAAITTHDGVVDLGVSPGDSSIVNSNTSSINKTIGVDIGLSDGCSVGVILGYVDATHFTLIDIESASGRIVVNAYRGGTAYTPFGTTLTGAANSFVSNSNHHVDIVCSGSVYTVKLDGVTMGTLTSPDAPVTGLVGLRNGQGGSGARYVDNITISSGSATPATCYRSLTNSDFIAEFALEFVSGGSVGFDFHAQDANNFQRISVAAGGFLSLSHSIAGTLTTLPNALAPVISTAPGYLHYVRVECKAGKITAYLDGEKQIDYTDGAYTFGALFGFWADGSVEARIRCLHLRAGNTVTLQGLTAGHTIVPRTPGGLPVGSYVVPASGVLSFAYPHFPLGSISDNGTDYTTADGGYIWGGDTLGAASTTTKLEKGSHTTGKGGH